jgi:2-polyprenyl-3-methyl-5-hydroxy-6-metoxy-1,4-benzoquinol methylase
MARAVNGIVNDLYADKTCGAPVERCERMRDLVMRHLTKRSAIRVLDLGCGTGSLVVELATALPNAFVTGLDISGPNIAAARVRLADHPASGRIVLERADYLTFRAEPFDLIVADGVLHLIPGPTSALMAKLAADLEANGLLVCAMPYDCLYNRVASVGRRLLRACRSPATDALILATGRLLHGSEMTDDGLKERVPYMYIPPERLETRALATAVAPSVGLYVIRQYAMPSTSAAQLKHRVTVFERRGPS